MLSDVETMIDLSPENLVRENIKLGLTSEDDEHSEVIRYYRLFIKGKAREITRLNGIIDKLISERAH